MKRLMQIYRSFSLFSYLLWRAFIINTCNILTELNTRYVSEDVNCSYVYVASLSPFLQKGLSSLFFLSGLSWAVLKLSATGSTSGFGANLVLGIGGSVAICSAMVLIYLFVFLWAHLGRHVASAVVSWYALLEAWGTIHEMALVHTIRWIIDDSLPSFSRDWKSISEYKLRIVFGYPFLKRLLYT